MYSTDYVIVATNSVKISAQNRRTFTRVKFNNGNDIIVVRFCKEGSTLKTITQGKGFPIRHQKSKVMYRINFSHKGNEIKLKNLDNWVFY